VAFVQQMPEKALGSSILHCRALLTVGNSPDQTWGVTMLKILTATAASLAMLGAAAAADLPRKEPPPPAPPVGKAPIGKYPVGKYPQPVVTKG